MGLLPKPRAGVPLWSLRSQIDQLFEDFFGREWGWPLAAKGAWSPAMEVSESDTDVVVRAEVPGMEAKDIEIAIRGDVLTISGEKKEEKEEKKKSYHRIETRYGSFERTVTLPAAVDVEKVKAECKKGVLSITLPKKEGAKPRKIEVKG